MDLRIHISAGPEAGRDVKDGAQKGDPMFPLLLLSGDDGRFLMEKEGNSRSIGQSGVHPCSISVMKQVSYQLKKGSGRNV